MRLHYHFENISSRKHDYLMRMNAWIMKKKFDSMKITIKNQIGFHCCFSGLLQLKTILTVLTIFISLIMYGQEESSTSITYTYEWSVTENITGVFTVGANEVLFIHPGTIITFMTPDSRLDVLGTVLAEGTETAFIVWTGANIGWSGIKLRNAQQALFNYCSFSNINPTVQLQEGGIFVSMTNNTTFNNCLYHSNKGGIVIVNSSNLAIYDCFFSGNNINGTVCGLIYLQNSTDANIRNNVFNNNITNVEGIISLNLSSSAQIINNYFRNTKYSNPTNPPIKGYPVIILNGSDYLNHAVINSNHFSYNFDREIVLWGTTSNNPSNIIALIWNNDFDGKKAFQSSRKRTAIFAQYSLFTVSKCTIHNYDAGGIRFNYCDAKIHLNNFHSNLTTDGVIRIDKYLGYSGPVINNEIFYNAFEENSGPNGASIWTELGIVNCNTAIDSNDFINNIADGKGGAIFAINSKNLLVRQNNFYQNTSSGSNGGAVCLDDPVSNIELIGNDFVDNTSNQFGGGVMVDFTYNSLLSSLLIKDNSFDQNAAIGGGGGLAVIAAINSIQNTIYIRKNNFMDNNTDENGGAFYLKQIKAIVDSNFVQGNKANYAGGIWASDMSSLEISDNKVFLNEASESGGGILLQNCGKTSSESEIFYTAFLIRDNDIYRNKYGAKGGGLYLQNTNEVEFVRNFIRDNYCEDYNNNPTGAGIYVLNSNLKFYNNNILSNWGGSLGGGLYFDISSSNSLVFNNNNVVNHYSEGGLVFPNGNLDIDNISINNCLFYGNDLNSIRYPKATSSSPKMKVSYCYFDMINGQSSQTWVDLIDCQIELWPGWIALNKFYLDCDDTICVDNGDPSIGFNDPDDPGVPGTPDPPSCKTLRNDIGISGGPFAMDNGFIFDATAPPGLVADFQFEIIDNENKRIQVIDKCQVELEGVEYQWEYGDGKYSEIKDYPGLPDFDYEYDQSISKTLLTLILKSGKDFSCHTEIIDFGANQEKGIVSDVNQILSSGLKSNENLVTVFPNPSDDKFEVSFNRTSEEPGYLKICDVFGRLIYSSSCMNFSNRKYSIDLTNELPGIYYLMVVFDGNIFSEKLILK